MAPVNQAPKVNLIDSHRDLVIYCVSLEVRLKILENSLGTLSNAHFSEVKEALDIVRKDQGVI